jgi:predicted CXXCH cytochrome family protein
MIEKRRCTVRHIVFPIFAVGFCGLLALGWGGQSPPGQETAKKKYTREELITLDVSGTCITADCHSDLKQLRFRHGPTAQNKCDPCHQSVGGKHVFTAPAKGNQLCLQCHDPVPLGKVQHKPVRENCQDCHAIHGENNRFFLIGGEGSAVCMKCHKDVERDMEYLHGPFQQGLCLACHEPHESDNLKLLTAPPDKFCATCHEELADDAKKARYVHKPFAEDCGGCHAAHGGKFRYFLLAAENRLCIKCHEKEIEAGRNLKYRHETFVEKEQCSTCHLSHFSNFEKLLKQQSGPLCLGCHNRTYEREGQRPIADIQEQIARAKFLHGPIRDHTCIPCHEAHGSNNVGMLRYYFPPRFYAPFSEANYALCFDCHDKKIVLQPESRDTSFRNGLQNLHYLHVNREKGRTCRACHAEHASNHPAHIRDTVPYGKWVMELECEMTATGGACATACHARYAYDRQTPVKNETTEK